MRRSLSRRFVAGLGRRGNTRRVQPTKGGHRRVAGVPRVTGQNQAILLEPGVGVERPAKVPPHTDSQVRPVSPSREQHVSSHGSRQAGPDSGKLFTRGFDGPDRLFLREGVPLLRSPSRVGDHAEKVPQRCERKQAQPHSNGREQKDSLDQHHPFGPREANEFTPPRHC